MRYAFGIDIGGTRTKIGLVELETGQVCGRRVFPTEQTEERFLLEIKRQAEEITKLRRGIDITGIGAAVSGYVHKESGKIDGISGSFISFFPSYPIKSKLSELFNLPCRVENDATAACWGEALYGAGKSFERVLMLTLGTGIGIGFIADKKISWRNSLLHRAGHIKVGCRTVSGYECYCGIEGCLESICSGKALEERAEAVYRRPMTAESLFEQVKTDLKAEKLVKEYLESLSVGLNQYIYLYAPDVIVLGGGVAKALGIYIREIRDRTTAKVYQDYLVDIAVSKLEENAGILGSAALFL